MPSADASLMQPLEFQNPIIESDLATLSSKTCAFGKFFFSPTIGVSVIGTQCLDSQSIELFTYSAGGKNGGFGIYFGGKWAHGAWRHSWFLNGLTRDMTLLGFLSVLVTITIWHQSLSHCQHCSSPGAQYTNFQV